MSGCVAIWIQMTSWHLVVIDSCLGNLSFHGSLHLFGFSV